jgi:hypothetical protein
MKMENKTSCNYSRNGEGWEEIKENDVGGEFNYDVRSFINVTMYHQ